MQMRKSYHHTTRNPRRAMECDKSATECEIAGYPTVAMVNRQNAAIARGLPWDEATVVEALEVAREASAS